MEKIAGQTYLHTAALAYASRGIPVLPYVRNRDMRSPLVREASADIDQINAWWNKHPDFNVGIETGEKSGIIVLNFLTSEAWAFAREKGLPDTPMVKTAKGCHVYCHYQNGIEAKLNRQGIAIDLLGEGRNVIAPPSVLRDGPSSVFQKTDIFSWVDGKGLGDMELAEVPEWLLTEIREEREESPVLVITEGEEPSTPEIKYDAPPLGDEVVMPKDPTGGERSKQMPMQLEDWKAPVLFEGFGVDEINADLLPSWLGEYAGAISKSKQTPEGLAVMLGLSIVATCLQKKFIVAPHGDEEYTEQLSLWTVTILKSAERKSPILNAMRAPIIAWEKEQAESLKTRIQETTTARSVCQQRIDALQKDAAKIAEHEARQKKIEEINEIKASMPDQVRAPMLWTSDVTAETLQDMLADNDERMALLSDEGVIFEIMAGLYSDNKVNIDIFLQAYSGTPTKIMRKTRRVDLDKPALTFGLAVQPVVIESFASGSKKQFRGKGALGRFLFCLPNSMLGKRVVGTRNPVPPEVKLQYEEGIKGLLSVPKVVDAAGSEIPRMLTLDAEAFSAWEEFDRRVEKMIGPGGELEAMDDWGGKLPGNALRVAGLLHLVENGPDLLIIGKDTLDRSIRLCDLLIGHAKAAFGLIGADEVVSDAKKVFMWMQKNGFEVFTKTECARALKGISELDSALKTLEERNILKELLVPTAGRSAANYISNPILKSTFG